MAAVGVYRKATTGLVSSMLSFDEDEELTWATELLPISTLEGQAHSDPALEPPPPCPGEDWDRPFAGLHCAALTATGPTGTRAETHHGRAQCASASPRQQAPRGAVSLVLLDRFTRPPVGSRARGSAGSARRTASRDPSRWSVPRSCQASSNPWWPTVRLTRWWRPIWTLSTFLATLNGHPFARSCARTSRRPKPGLLG